MVRKTTNGDSASIIASSYTPNRFGRGVWEECPGPGLDVKFDKDTMPLQLKTT